MTIMLKFRITYYGNFLKKVMAGWHFCILWGIKHGDSHMVFPHGNYDQNSTYRRGEGEDRKHK